MTSQRQRPWHHSARQQTLLEYINLKQQCPDGVYISLKPGSPLQWFGVLFVREGPYASAILRFQIVFPSDYPLLPPTLTFTTEIFHPLVTPLTTYTYTTGSSSSDTVSATDEERLPPGSFSLRHGFSHWFGRAQKSGRSSTTSSRNLSGSSALSTPVKSSPAIAPTPELEPRTPFHTSTGITKAISPLSLEQHGERSTIYQVLIYVQKSFTEDEFIDRIPLEAAGNTGAWKAWRAHRTTLGMKISSAAETESSVDEHEEWNWDDVWEQRVRKCIETSKSDAVLYGGTSGSDDLIHFGELDEKLLADIKVQIFGRRDGSF